MCLTTKDLREDISYSHQELLKKHIKVAKKDIVVYKRFNPVDDTLSDKELAKYKGKLVTPYQDAEWPESGMLKVDDFGIESTDSDTWSVEIGEGIHAWISKKEAEHCEGELLKQMIIPKGTKYVEGTEGDIVALKMWLKDRWDARSKRTNTKPSKRRVAKK